MTKHIKRFDTLDVAKQATLYSPVLTKIADRILVSVIGNKDTELEIVGDSIDDVAFEEKVKWDGLTWRFKELSSNLYESFEGVDYSFVIDGLTFVDEVPPRRPIITRHLIWSIDIDFTCGNANYNSIILRFTKGPTSSIVLYYDETNYDEITDYDEIFGASTIWNDEPSFFPEEYRTIKLSEPATGELLTFLEANAERAI